MGKDIIIMTKNIGIINGLNMKKLSIIEDIIKKNTIAISQNEVENKDSKRLKEITKNINKIHSLIIGGMKINSTERLGSTERMDSLDIIFGIPVMIICLMIIWTIGKNGQKLLILKHQEILTEKIVKIPKKAKNQKRVKSRPRKATQRMNFMPNYANMEVQ